MSEQLFTVPKELEHLATDTVRAVHELHASRSYRDLLKFTADSENDSLFAGGDNMSQALVIANEGAYVEAGVTLYPFAYQQAWKPSWAARLQFYHDVVNPHGFTIAYPNNSGKKQYYNFEDSDMARLNNGDLSPLYERHMRTAEKLLRGTAAQEIRIAGYSQGAVVGLGMAALGSDLPITSVHAFEAPSEERTDKKLKKDFTKSGGPLDQRASIADAALASLSAALRLDRMGADYVRFGLDTLDAGNKVQMKAMATPNLNGLLGKIISQSDALVTLGYVDGSLMRGECNPLEDEQIRVVTIAHGDGSHRHATGDNVVANALMMSL